MSSGSKNNAHLAHKIYSLYYKQSFATFEDVRLKVADERETLLVLAFCPLCHHEVEECESKPNADDDRFIYWKCPRCDHHMKRIRHAHWVSARQSGTVIQFANNTTVRVAPTVQPRLEDR